MRRILWLTAATVVVAASWIYAGGIGGGIGPGPQVLLTPTQQVALQSATTVSSATVTQVGINSAPVANVRLAVVSPTGTASIGIKNTTESLLNVYGNYNIVGVKTGYTTATNVWGDYTYLHGDDNTKADVLKGYLSYTQTFSGDTAYGYVHETHCNSTAGIQYGFLADADFAGLNIDTYYGFYARAGQMTSTDKWGLYVKDVRSFLGQDNVKTYWGTGLDAAISYTGATLAIESVGGITYTPSAAQEIKAAGTAILANAATVILDPTENLTLTSAPTIADGVVGQRLTIMLGNAEANTVAIQDQGTLASSNLRLPGTSLTLSAGDVAEFLFDGSDWLLVSYSDNDGS